MAAKAYAGTLFLRVDGVMVSIDGDFKVQPNLTENTGVAGASGVLGFTTKFVVPSITGTIADGGSVSVKALTGITDSTITCELVNGKSYVLSQAFWSGSSEVDVIAGKIPVKYEGFNCSEIVA